ncbi:MAG: hypothetical protein EXR77_12650 [Myxococcales bacterium]|nr:hypothetical protein [Myxococcales bacterium]
MQLRGTVDSELVGQLLALDLDTLPVVSGDLRLAVLRPDAHVGRLIGCVSMGLPLPEATIVGDPQLGRLDKTPLANRKAWVVCAQVGSLPVHLTLFFRNGDQDQLLKVVRGSHIEALVLGAQDGKVPALYERTTASRTLPVAAHTDTPDLQSPDFRRFILLDGPLRGSQFACKLAKQPDWTPAPPLPAAALQLVPQPAAGPPAVVYCADSVRPVDGQRFALFWPPALHSHIASWRAGATVEVQFVGVVENWPVVVALAVAPAPK